MRPLSRSNAAARALAPKLAQVLTQLEVSNAEIVSLKAQLQVAAETLESINATVNPDQVIKISFYTMIDNQLTKVEDMQLHLGKQRTLSLSIKDAGGNDAQVQEGSIVWSVTDGALAVVTPAADGMSAVVVPVGPLGSLQVEVSADADLGEGVKTVSGFIEVDILAGEAVSLNIAAGEEVDIVV